MTKDWEHRFETVKSNGKREKVPAIAFWINLSQSGLLIAAHLSFIEPYNDRRPAFPFHDRFCRKHHEILLLLPHMSHRSQTSQAKEICLIRE